MNQAQTPQAALETALGKVWCTVCTTWIAPLESKCPKCGRGDNNLVSVNQHLKDLESGTANTKPEPEVSTFPAPTHGYTSEQPTHDMIKAGVMAWDTWHSVIEVWRQMETVRRWQANKRQG